MDDLVERLPKEAAMLREIAQSYSRGIEWQANLSASAAMTDLAAARIQALETSLAEAEARVIAEVVAWLRGQEEEVDASRIHWNNREIIASTVANVATALETGEWCADGHSGDSPSPPPVV